MAMENIEGADIEDLMNSIISEMNLKADVLTSLFELFAYEGYNPKDFFVKLWNVARKTKNLTKKEFIEDMRAIITLYVTRGTRIEKLKDKSNKNGITRIAQLTKRYEIVSYWSQEEKTYGKTIPSDVITIARIVGCFPTITCEVMSIYNRPIGKVPKGLPTALCWAGAPSVIPTDRENLYKLWLDWANDFDRVIKGTNANPELVDKYGRITWKSNFVDEDTRKATVAKYLKGA